MKVALIPCGMTEWHEDGRLLGRVELPMTSAGQQRCAAWAQALAPLGLGLLLHGRDELATQTAAVLARRLGAATKPLKDLAEVDVGLWAGLTEPDLKARYASAYRELGEAPLNVCPPAGEGLSAASRRLRACLLKQVSRNGAASVGVVLRPLAFALLRCTLEERELSNVWAALRGAAEPVVIDGWPAAGTAHDC